jgi:5-methyltetrahydropteroyltriglutamate--homocysteine methyltransferase
VKAECSDFRHALDAAGNPFVEPFLTAPSPGMVSAIVLNEHYPSEEAYLAALGRRCAMSTRQSSMRASCSNSTARTSRAKKHNTFADRPLADFIAFGNRVIDAINAAIHDIPPEKVRLHVCWGNYEGPHDLDVELREIIPFLRRAKVGGFVLPFANPRHAHEYRYLKDLLSKDQIIVAGVIDSTTNFVEHPEVIAERLENVAKTIRRSASRDGGERLRLRDHRGTRAGRRGRGVGEVQIDGGGRKARVVAAVLVNSTKNARGGKP